MSSLWQKDSWVRLLGLCLGLGLCAQALQHYERLPWAELSAFAVLAFLLRLRPVPLLRDSTGTMILAHVPGESLFVLLLLRHGPDAAVVSSLLTNLLAFGRIWRSWYPFPERRLSSTSLIFWMPGIIWLQGTLYQSFGGIALRHPADCMRLFNQPGAVFLPLVGALLIAHEVLNRLYQGVTLHLRHGVAWRQALGDLKLGLFEHLETAGALLALALWTTWGWGTLPFIFLVMEAMLLSARERMQRLEARKQALSDPLTGLASARGLSEALARALANPESSFALLFLDMDHFKAVNDTHGHRVGDLLLALVGKTLRNGVRPEDLVARRGGDEFVVLLPGYERAAAEALREQLHHAAQQALLTDPRFSGAGFSAGISVFPGDGQTEEALLDAADQAMYAEKRRCRAA